MHGLHSVVVILDTVWIAFGGGQISAAETIYGRNLRLAGQQSYDTSKSSTWSVIWQECKRLQQPGRLTKAGVTHSILQRLLEANKLCKIEIAKLKDAQSKMKPN